MTSDYFFFFKCSFYIILFSNFCICEINYKSREKISSGTDQLPQLCSTQVDFPPLCSAGHSSLIGHVLQRALLLLCVGGGGDKPFTLSELEAATIKFIPHPATRAEHLTFDPDVAVPLEVVVGGFPGVAVVAQERDGRARPDGDVAHSFLVCGTGVKEGRKKEGGEVNGGGDARAAESAERHAPTYSLGGDSRRSERTLTGRPGAFSSSVLLVSTISLSSVEMTCCCLRGFFLGEAPGMRSPGAGAPRAEA